MTEIRQVLGYSMTAATMAEVVGLCWRSIDDGERLQIGVLNAAKIVNAERDDALQAAIRACDIIVADGQSVVWASRLLGQPLPERVTGIDLFLELLALADRKHLAVFLLGGTAAVNGRVVDVVGSQFPGARIAGHRDGYFTDDDAVAREIAGSAPDMLFVAMGSPRKEIFLQRHQALMQVPLTHGVGGSFDILAGVTKRAPARWQSLGMEWAYRLLQEPGRMWKRYLRTNVLFGVMVGRALGAQHPGLFRGPGRMQGEVSGDEHA